MSEDIQSLLEKINREGVEKARSEAAAIVAEAEKKAQDAVKEATTKAEAIVSSAEKDAERYLESARETLRQAARDMMAGIEQSITKLLEKLLEKEVSSALSSGENAAQLVFNALNEATGTGVVTCGGGIAAAIREKLASSGNFTVVTDEGFGGGFTVKFDNGRVEHDFTVETISRELAKRLRPDLAALMK